jgi:hypothetical protein
LPVALPVAVPGRCLAALGNQAPISLDRFAVSIARDGRFHHSVLLDPLFPRTETLKNPMFSGEKPRI